MKSKEEIIASKLDDLLADSRIEPHLVGRYFAQMARTDVYDNFEELALSARHEKENRIEWLKKAILGDKKMETTLDSKCKILSELWTNHSGDDEWQDFFLANDLGLPLAFAIENDLIIGLTKDGESYIHNTFADLLENLEVNDDGFTNLQQILEA